MSATIGIKKAYVAVTQLQLPLRLTNNLILPQPTHSSVPSKVETMDKDKETSSSSTETENLATPEIEFKKPKDKPKPKKPPPKKAATATQSRKRKRVPKTLEDLFAEDQKLMRCGYCEKPFTHSDFLELHMKTCISIPKDYSERKEESKADYLSILGLSSKTDPPKIQNMETKFVCPRPLSLTSSNARKSQIKKYFKPSKMSLTYPQSIKLFQHGIGKCTNPQAAVDKYQYYCYPYPRVSRKKVKKSPRTRRNRTTKPIDDSPPKPVKSRKTKKSKTKVKPESKKTEFKKGDYVHTYCFNKRQKIRWMNEKTIGLKTKCFKYLNMCKPLRVQVTQMTDKDIADYLGQLEKKRAATILLESGTIKRHRINLPVNKCSVELDDIKFKPEFSQYFKSGHNDNEVMMEVDNEVSTSTTVTGTFLLETPKHDEPSSSDAKKQSKPTKLLFY